MDPISKRRLYLSEIVPAGPRAGDQAEKVRTPDLGSAHNRVDQPGNSESMPAGWDGYLAVR